MIKGATKAAAKVAGKFIVKEVEQTAVREAERFVVREGEEIAVRNISNEGTTLLRNGHLANGVHPKTGVPFDANGFPNFSDYLHRGGPSDFFINPTGNRMADFAQANLRAGYNSTPKGFTWHHHQDFGRMQLVESNIHSRTAHTGGFSLWEF